MPQKEHQLMVGRKITTLKWMKCARKKIDDHRAEKKKTINKWINKFYMAKKNVDDFFGV